MQDDLLPLFEERQGELEERPLAAHGDERLLGGPGRAVALRIALRQRLPQGRDTLVLGVFGKAVGERLARRFDRDRRGGEVGLAGAEVHDVDSLRLHLHGSPRHLEGRRLADPPHPGR
jgi:hypothetical protein